MRVIFNRALKLSLKREVTKVYNYKLLKTYGISSYNEKPMSMWCQDIGRLNKCERDKFISSFDTVLSDCDGVLWVGGKAIKGSPEAISHFRELGKRVIFVTNNGMSRKSLLERCHELGFGGQIDDMITSSYLCAHYLKERKFTETVYLFGGKGLKEELDNVGIDNVGEGPDAMPEEWDLETAENVMNTMVNNIGCVIVGFHYDLSYMKLLKAVTYLQNPEVMFLGTNSDPMAAVHFESRTCIMPATGALIAATQTASGRSPTILGKPDKFMFDAVKRVFPEIKPDRTLMIGDRADTDVVFGKNAGLITLMVGTGTNNKTDIQDWEMSNDDTHKKLIPNYYSESLFKIFEWNDSGVTKENDDREVAQ